MAGIGDGHNGGGPIWAIFDADAVEREKWDPKPPNVDYRRRASSSAPTRSPSSPSKIEMKYQRVPMPPQNLEATVARYNGFVDAGGTDDFGKPRAALQDRQAAVLRRLGDAGASTTPAPAAHQRQLPGRRHERRGDPRPLLRRRVGGRLQHARPRPLRPARASSPAATPRRKTSGHKARRVRYASSPRRRDPGTLSICLATSKAAYSPAVRLIE